MKNLSLFIFLLSLLSVTSLLAQDEQTEEPKDNQQKEQQDESKQDEPKQDEPKQDESKQDESKQDKPKQDREWPVPITHYSETGLMYGIITKGEGESPNKGDIVTAHYTGKLLSGKVFDSSVERGAPFQFQVGVGQVIKGWDEALSKMKKGEKRLIVLPPHLAYGSKGAGSVIPPDSFLVFEVELLDFVSK